MSYGGMSLREIFRTNSLIKELRGTGKGTQTIARLALQINRGQWIYIESAPGIEEKMTPTWKDANNPFIAKQIFEEELTKVGKEKSKNPKEWINKLFYKNMIKNAIKLSDEIGSGKVPKNHHIGVK